MCSPPPKRSRAATSARRQHVLVTASLLSSSLTAAVMATFRSSSCVAGGRGVPAVRGRSAAWLRRSPRRDARPGAGVDGDRRRWSRPAAPLGQGLREGARGRGGGCRRASPTAASRCLGAEGLGAAAQPVGLRARRGCRRRRRRGAGAGRARRARRGAAPGENPAVSPGCGARLSTSTRRASLSTRAVNSSGTSRCGRTLENHDPGPRVMTSAARRASHGLRAGPRPARVAAAPAAPARAWWRPRPGRGSGGRRRAPGRRPRGRRCRSRRPRCPPAAGSSAAPARAPRAARQAWSRAATGSSRTSSRPASTRLPTAWPGERAVPAEAVLEDPLPERGVVGPAGPAWPGEGAERHPQVAQRQDVQLAADAPGRAAVVGDRDHGGEVVGEPAQRRRASRAGRGRRRATTARSGPGAASADHSRPTSRCDTVTRTPSSPAIRRRELLGDRDAAVLAAGAARRATVR